MKIALFITCLTENYFPRAGIAAVKVLEHLGHDVAFPRAQTCCGQPMFNNGFHADARDLARRMIRVFEPHGTVVTPSGSCAAMVREHYPHLFLEGSAEHGAAVRLAGRTFEFVEFLVKVLKVDLAALGVRWPGSATCHFSCHLRGLGMTDEADRLLGQVAGLELRPLENANVCCGFGGTFAMAYPTISGAMARDKAESIRRSGAATVVSNEAGCTMNIAGACRRAGIGVNFESAAEIIAEGLGLLERGARQ